MDRARLGAGPIKAEPLILSIGAPTAPAKAVTVIESKDSITVDTGTIQCLIGKTGEALIESISRDGQ